MFFGFKHLDLRAGDKRNGFAQITNRSKLLKTQNVLFSFQVVNEVCVNLIRKYKFDEIEIKKVITSFFSRYQAVTIDKNTFLTASDLRLKYNFSYYDSLIVAALTANAAVLYSEDMHDGLIVENKLKIINPF